MYYGYVGRRYSGVVLRHGDVLDELSKNFDCRPNTLIETLTNEHKGVEGYEIESRNILMQRAGPRANLDSSKFRCIEKQLYTDIHMYMYASPKTFGWFRWI
jgi:hypothetical protein